MPICIAGMHRAGTSMVARLLEGRAPKKVVVVPNRIVSVVA